MFAWLVCVVWCDHPILDVSYVLQDVFGYSEQLEIIKINISLRIG